MVHKFRGIDEQEGRIRIRVYRHGKQFFKSFRGSLQNPADARRAVRLRDEIKAQAIVGTHDETSEFHLFGDVAQEYMNTAALQMSTKKEYLKVLNTDWLPLSIVPISAITPKKLREIIHSKPRSNKTKANVFAPVRSVFKFALGEGYIEHNPCPSVVIQKHQSPPIDYFTPSEVWVLLDHLDGEIARYFTVFLGTGMRPSEILALERHDIQGDYCRVSKGLVKGNLQLSTKVHEVRDVFLEPHVLAALKTQMISITGDKVFPWITDKAPNTEYRLAMKRARLRYRSPYKCRHSRACELLTVKKVEPAFAARQMGHTLETFYKKYALWIDEEGNAAEIAKLLGNSTKTVSTHDKR